MPVDLTARTAAFRAFAATQPGATPYDNHRPIRVNKHSAGQPLSALLSRVAPFSHNPTLVTHHIARGWLTVDHKPPRPDQLLFAGNIVQMVIPDTTEPPVSPLLTVLHEDDHLLVFDKPSPLPVHPSGRFNRPTLVWLAARAWPDLTLKPVHRLDANTTGVLVCARTTDAARALVAQFRDRRTTKRYLARVHGTPDRPTFTIEAPITATPDRAGTRTIAPDGQAARTEVALHTALPDGTSLVELRPHTGRTHQLRLHLKSVGLPIVGDAAYAATPLGQAAFTRTDTPLCLHAHHLGFTHPATGRWMDFEAPVPAHFFAD